VDAGRWRGVECEWASEGEESRAATSESSLVAGRDSESEEAASAWAAATRRCVALGGEVIVSSSSSAASSVAYVWDRLAPSSALLSAREPGSSSVGCRAESSTVGSA
jgi:hypothetical protein